jgi:uncharacterized membrane protein
VRDQEAFAEMPMGRASWMMVLMMIMMLLVLIMVVLMMILWNQVLTIYHQV